MSRTLNLCEHLLSLGRRFHQLGVDHQALRSLTRLARLRVTASNFDTVSFHALPNPRLPDELWPDLSEEEEKKRTEHLERVDFIKQCQALGFSLDEIRELMDLKFRGTAPCQHVRDLLLDKIKQVETQIAGLQTFRKELLANVQECEKTLKRHRDDCCPVLERLEKPITQEQRETS